MATKVLTIDLSNAFNGYSSVAKWKQNLPNFALRLQDMGEIIEIRLNGEWLNLKHLIRRLNEMTFMEIIGSTLLVSIQEG